MLVYEMKPICYNMMYKWGVQTDVGGGGGGGGGQYQKRAYLFCLGSIWIFLRSLVQGLLRNSGNHGAIQIDVQILYRLHYL